MAKTTYAFRLLAKGEPKNRGFSFVNVILQAEKDDKKSVAEELKRRFGAAAVHGIRKPWSVQEEMDHLRKDFGDRIEEFDNEKVKDIDPDARVWRFRK